MRKAVALIDCDNFYASRERVFDARLRGRPRRRVIEQQWVRRMMPRSHSQIEWWAVQMTREEALSIVKKVIAEEGKENDVSKIDSSKGLLVYLDSLDLVEVLGELEGHLGIEIDDSDMIGIDSIDLFAAKIVELVARKEASLR